MNGSVCARQEGERRAEHALIRLLCAVSVWRTATTRLLPLCGLSAWWVTLLCLLPGLGLTALLRLMMHLTRTNTLLEAIRACLGRTGLIAASAVLSLLLLIDGMSSMTALTTLFTQGIGTRGTQLTLALLTGFILLFSLHREGLARAVYFLRWGMLAAALLCGVFLLADARLDHMFPLWGDGHASVRAAIKAGWSLAWPLVLLLTTEPCGSGRLRCGVLPVFGAVGAILLLILAVPHELLTESNGLAQSMLLSMRYVPNAVRIVAQSLLMLSFFLAIGAAAQLTSSSVCMPLRSRPSWLPYGLVGGLILTQAADIPMLWTLLESVSSWLLAPLLLLALPCLFVALVRRKTP